MELFVSIKNNSKEKYSLHNKILIYKKISKSFLLLKGHLRPFLQPFEGKKVQIYPQNVKTYLF